jgi:hypothetical protein
MAKKANTIKALPQTKSGLSSEDSPEKKTQERYWSLFRLPTSATASTTASSTGKASSASMKRNPKTIMA